jgi:acetyl-CoA carboxylase beta subunit
MIDAIVQRKEMKTMLSGIIGMHQPSKKKGGAR